jgi:DNA-binding CsgD family transcriptional regulator
MILQMAMDRSALERAWDEGRKMTLQLAIDTVLSATVPSDSPGAHAGDARLSAREVEVMRMIAEGLTDREIAARLFLSVRTVEAHVLRVRNRLGVKTRTAAVSVAMARGLLDPAEAD